MGLRGKIISLFFIGFGLMSVIAFLLLHTRLQEGFVEIERKQATEQMMQLAHNLNHELERLGQLNNDWGNWDDMYQYVQQPNRNFIEHQIIPAALQTVGLNFLLILDNNEKSLFSLAIDNVSGERENPSDFESVFAHVKQRIQHPTSGKTCGIDMSTLGPVMVCWHSIQQTNHSGKPVGTLVIGQRLNEIVLKRIQEQSRIDFQLTPLPASSAQSPLTPGAVIDSEEIGFSKSSANILQAKLNNIVGQPILDVRLQFPRNVSQQGREIIWKMTRALLLVTAFTGLTLLIGVHFLVIRRLRKMETELNSIWRNGRWSGRIDTKQSKDELNELAHAINRMLGLIRKQMEVLESNAYTDGLTQIANRRSFDQRLTIEMSLHKRNQTPLSILMLDVDYFKRYNDYYGHPAGDEVLKEIGKILSQIASRPSDVPARIGGEEFAVLLPDTDLEGATFVAEKVSAQLSKLQIPHADSDVASHVTISVGITSAGDESVANFLQRVDKATYSAKQSGRNQICVLPEAKNVLPLVKEA